jgi:CRISPR locus-related DNA-binding protein
VKRYAVMPCLLVFSFGWSEVFVSRAIVGRGGVSGDDLVVIVAPAGGVGFEEERYRVAVDGVRRFLANLGGRDPVEVRVDVGVDFEDLVFNISRELSRLLPGFTRVEFYLTGGMRLIVLALLFIADILSSLGIPVKVYSGPEDSPRIVKIPLGALGAVSRLTSRQVDLLRELVGRGEVRPGDEGFGGGVDASTVRRILDKLAVRGLVVKSRRGPRVVYKATGLTRAVVSLHDAMRGG